MQNHCDVIISVLYNIVFGGVKGILTISGALTLVYIATLFNASRCIYTKSGFFVYAFHGFPILILSKVIVMIFQPSNSIM